MTILMLLLGLLLAGCTSTSNAPKTAPPPPGAAEALPDDPPRTQKAAEASVERVVGLLARGETQAARQLAEGYFGNSQTRSLAGVYSLIELARYYWSRERYDDLIDAVEAIPRQVPEHREAPWALLIMAQARLVQAQQGKDADRQYRLLKEAAGYLDTYIERYPRGEDMPEVLYWSGVTAQQMGELDKADKRYRRLRREHPDTTWNARLGPSPPKD